MAHEDDDLFMPPPPPDMPADSAAAGSPTAAAGQSKPDAAKHLHTQSTSGLAFVRPASWSEGESDDDGAQPPVEEEEGSDDSPAPSPPAGPTPLPTPMKHIRRGSALGVFDLESAQTFADLQSRMHTTGATTTITSPVQHRAPNQPTAATAPVSPALSPISPSMVSGSSSCLSSGQFSAAGTPLSRSTSTNTSTNGSGAATPMAAFSAPTSGAITPMLSRRGSDFRPRIGSVPLLPSALFSALSPSSTSQSGNKSACVLSGCTAFASRNGYCLRHVWKLSVEELEPLNQKQYQVAKELVTTEKSYAESLRVLAKSFVLRLQVQAELDPSRALLDPLEMSRIFHNIEDIYKLSEQLSSDLEEVTLEKVLTMAVGSTLLHYAPLFRIYQSYLENYDDAVRVLHQTRKEKGEFDFFCRWQEKCEGQSLESFLIQPVQRLPRYLLLLTELIKRSSDASGVPEGALADMVAARDRISAIATAINLSLHQKEKQNKVLLIQSQFERDSRYQDLVSPNRYLVRQGPLKKKYGKGSRHFTDSTTYHFFLFNDVLVYADASKNLVGKGSTYRMKHLLPLADMVVEAITGTSSKTKDRDIAVTTKSGGSSKSFELTCADTAERDEWVAAFKEAIAALKSEQSQLKSAKYDGSDMAGGGAEMSQKSSKLKQMMGV